LSARACGSFCIPSRAGLDGLTVADFADYADPAALYAEVDLPSGLQDFTNFSDPQITADLEQARSTANPDQRAALLAQAEKLTMQQLLCTPTCSRPQCCC
jgi:peptide/nickel transport system substrate-binding protein